MSIALELITILLGGTSVIGVVQAIRYRKENKSLKAAEAEAASIVNQSAQMDLADKYKALVLEMAAQVQDALGQGNAELKSAIGELNSQLSVFGEKLDKNIQDTNDIIKYLNGKFVEFKQTKCYQMKEAKEKKEAEK